MKQIILIISTMFIAYIPYAFSKEKESFYRSPLSAGLPATLEKLESRYSLNQNNTIYLIVNLPKTPLDFSSPNKLSQTVLSNIKRNGSIGHLQLAWSCKINDKIYRSATGFTGDHENNSFNMIKNGHGVTPVITIFKDGNYETPNQIEKKLNNNSDGQKAIFSFSPSNGCRTILNNIWKTINDKDSYQFKLGQEKNKNDSTNNCATTIEKWLSSEPKIKNFIAKSVHSVKIDKNLFGNKKNIVDLKNISIADKWPSFGVKVDLFDISKIEHSMSSVSDLLDSQNQIKFYRMRN